MAEKGKTSHGRLVTKQGICLQPSKVPRAWKRRATSPLSRVARRLRARPRSSPSSALSSACRKLDPEGFRKAP